MSEILNVENGAVYEGYDSVAAGQWCTPTFLGCSVCAGASAVEGQVTLTLALNTPFGNVTKSFTFNTNTSFTWQPFSKFKVTVSIANFNEVGGTFSFDLGLKACVDIPFLGWKCFEFNHHFVVPLFLAGIHNSITDSQFSSVLALHASGGLKDDCKCDDQKGNLLQGDIYSNYLAGQQHFPTMQPSQCLPYTLLPFCPTRPAAVGHASGAEAAIPTLPINQCIFTIFCKPGAPAEALQAFAATPGFTSIWPVCGTPPAGTAQGVEGGFPTLPINQCIFTVMCKPATAEGGLHASAAAGFPTIPVYQCIVSFMCKPGAQSEGGLQSNAANQGFTHIWPVCATASAGNAQDSAAGFPTIPVNQCIFSIGCKPGAAAEGGLQANAAAGFPTWPIQSCLPIPTLPINQCIVSIICRPGAADGGLQSHAVAGFPTWPTLPTGVPTIPALCAFTIGCNPGTANGGLQSNAAAGFPTIPVNQCIFTILCKPAEQAETVKALAATPGFTNVWPICGTPPAGTSKGVEGGFPTLPINQCIFTVLCKPATAEGSLQAHAAAPGITNVWPLCATATPNAQDSASGFPTIPVNQCIFTILCKPAEQAETVKALAATPGFTNVWPICGTPQAGTAKGVEGGFPTLPINQCIFTVLCKPAATAEGGLHANAAAGFPTWPIQSCLPQIPTIPVYQCIVSFVCKPGAQTEGALQSNAATQGFTHIWPVCASADAGAQSHVGGGFPTWPIQSCFPVTAVPNCLPTYQCFPTVICP